MRNLLLCIALLAPGCSTLIIDPLEQMRETNVRNLQRVAVGHTRLEVESLMGSDRAGGGLPEVVFGRIQYLQARNPMREETVAGNDGVDYQVLFYYTDLRTKDDKITDDELTPVVFRDGKVAGVGYVFLGALAPKYKSLAP
ncbi:MAG TPA: DUF3192 domain-containing protein [Burkholderiales bacterium]|nr:DUF3192 domain-containing protein [Burkholderiales bacterium]